MLRGRCACNAVAFEVSDAFVAAYVRHCSNCRAMAGSAFLPGHMFVGSKAPWYEILDDLPRHDGYPWATDETG